MVRAGYGRSYDIGVFGSTFGHTVTQNLPVLAVQELNPPNNFDSVFNLAQGPPPPVFPAVPSNGRFPLPNGIFAHALPEKKRLSHVDAYNVTLQRRALRLLLRGDRVRRQQGRTASSATAPPPTPTSRRSWASPSVPRDQRRPFFAGPSRVRTP